MPEPLPLAEFLEALKAGGLPIGMREHLAVGRLLSRWNDLDTASLRVALGALLARNPDEVKLVRDSFDALYAAPTAAVPESRPASGEERRDHKEPRLRRPPLPRRWLALGAAVLLALALLAVGLLWQRSTASLQILPSPQAPVPASAPRPPAIPDTVVLPDRERALLTGAGAAALLLLWLFGIRLGREAQRRARRRWSAEADALPGPHTYNLTLDCPALPVSGTALDDAAGLLGRRAADPPRHGEIDVPRTVERTLRAGLAPQVAFRCRASHHPVLVLEEVGNEMRSWQRTVGALLAGLEVRGVSLDHWKFDGDASRLFRKPGDPVMSLKQLFRLRSESPLLVIGTGAELAEGLEGKPAPWLATLGSWRFRAWLHPVTDPAFWHPALRQPDPVPLQVWPLTAKGLLAAARQLARGDLGQMNRQSMFAFSDRPVTALDLERLCWLVSLAPRCDPDLAEQLRQRFCPHVPPAAILGVLDMPLPQTPPHIGPPAGEVHAFLIGLFDRSRPERGTAAFERWRLDRALQELRVPGHEPAAVRELATLVDGPLAGEVAAAVEATSGVAAVVRSLLRRQVLRAVRWRAAAEKSAPAPGLEHHRKLAWEALPELVAAALCLVTLAWTLPSFSDVFSRQASVKLKTIYSLSAEQHSQGEPVLLKLAGPPDDARPGTLFEAGESTQTAVALDVLLNSSSSLLVTSEIRNRWVYFREDQPRPDGTLGVSNLVWVDSPSLPELAPQSTTPAPPVVAEPKPQLAVPDNPQQRPARPRYGTLVVTNFPAGAPPQSLTIDGRSWSGRDVRLPAGVHQLVLQDPSNSYRETILIRAGETVTVRVRGKSPDKYLAAITSALTAPGFTSISPEEGEPGELILTITGSNLDANAIVTISGDGVRVLKPSPYEVHPRTILIRSIIIDKTATPGQRDVKVINPDGGSAILLRGFEVKAPSRAEDPATRPARIRP